jgi:hypothetical protein
MFGAATSTAEEKDGKQRARHMLNLLQPEAWPILKPG